MHRCLPLLIAAASTSLWAQSGELWISGGASVLANANLGSPSPDGLPSDTQMSSGFRVGFRFDLNSSGRIGHEIQYGYNRANFRDNTGTILPGVGSAGMGIHHGGYNVLYYVHTKQEEPKMHPFVTAGFHFSDFVLPGSAKPQGGSVKPGGNFGGGLKVRLSPLFGFRFDIREYITGKPNWSGLLVNRGGLLYQTEISAGIGAYF